MVDSYFNKKSRKEINPDEVVSLGCVMFGNNVPIREESDYKFRIRSLVPLCLGVEVDGGMFDIIVSRAK